MSSGAHLYFVPFRYVEWFKLINLIESNKARLRIHDYILEQKTLRNVMYHPTQ